MQAQQVLHKILNNTCPDMHKTRRTALEANILSALTGQRLTVTDLGRSLSSHTTQKHNIKRADRLLSNRHLHLETVGIYRALNIQLLGQQQRPIILIDWSDMDEYKQHYLLRAGLAMGGRSITLYEQVYPLEHKEKRLTHQKFLQQLKSVLPENCRPIIVTDAGFRTTWFKLIEALDWDWLGRVRNRNYMRWTRGGPWFDAKKCYTTATGTAQFLGEGVLTKSNQHTCHFVTYRGKRQGRKHKNRLGDVAKNSHSRKQAAGQREPWLLATSLRVTVTLAKKVVQLYHLRMQIEESFRDVKSHRFGLSLSYHRTGSVARLSILLLIAALALIVLWLLGTATALLNKHYQFQANSVRNKTVLSVIFVGFQMISDNNTILTREDIEHAWEHLKLRQHHLYQE